MTSIWPVEKEWSKITRAVFQVNKIAAWRREVKAFFSLCFVLWDFLCFHTSIDFTRGRPSCAWRSMFLCKLQSFQPSRGDSGGRVAALQSVEAALKAGVGCPVTAGHNEVTIPLVEKPWVPLAWGVQSGAPVHSSAKETARASASSSRFASLTPGFRIGNHQPASRAWFSEVLRALTLLQ